MNKTLLYLKHRFEYYLVKLIVAVVINLSWAKSYRFGVFLGDLAYRILGGYRDIARRNLDFVYRGKLNSVQVDAMVREVFRNIGRGTVEFIRLSLLDEDNMDDFVSVEGLEHLRRALDQEKGVILVSGHLGNWELGAAALAMKGYTITALVLPQANGYVDKLINYNRSRAGMRVVPTGGTGVKDAMRCLRDKSILIALIDQNAYGGGIFVDFFGAPASTVRGPAALALRFGCPMVPVFTFRENGKLRMIFHEPLNIISTGEKEKDIAQTMAALTKLVESYTLRYPEQWFCWLHPRWQTRPPDEEKDHIPVEYQL